MLHLLTWFFTHLCMYQFLPSRLIQFHFPPKLLHPDIYMTFAVHWVLKANYLSVYPQTSLILNSGRNVLLQAENPTFTCGTSNTCFSPTMRWPFPSLLTQGMKHHVSIATCTYATVMWWTRVWISPSSNTIMTELTAAQWFKGNIGETPERRGGAAMGLPERIDTILSWAELNWTELNSDYLYILYIYTVTYRHMMQLHFPHGDHLAVQSKVQEVIEKIPCIKQQNG